MKKVELLGVKINTEFTTDDALSEITKLLSAAGSHIVCTTNPEFIMEAQQDKEFMNIINDAALSLPDGNGVLMASTYIKSIENYRPKVIYPFAYLIKGFSAAFRTKSPVITGVDLVERICSMAANEGLSVLFIGGWPQDILGRMKKNVTYDLAERVAQTLKNRHPNLKIVGATSQFSYHLHDDKRTLAYIKEKMAEQNIDVIDFVFVAYGQKNQEKWIMRNLDKIPGKIGIGVGGGFAYIGNEVRRPSVVIKSMKLEWLFRFITQPWRIRRILTAFPLFPLKIYFDSVRNNKHF